MYVILTIKTFQSLPPVPLLDIPNHPHFRGVYTDPNGYNNPNHHGSHPRNPSTFPHLLDNTFPQSIHDKPLETIQHPAVEISPNLSGQIPDLTVPAFYDPPQFHGGIRKYLGNYGEQLMTPTQAKSVGSVVDDGIAGLETIFVAIASYRDFQCRQTVEGIFQRADYPNRVRVAVVDQFDVKVGDVPCSKPEVPCEQDENQVLCLYESQIDFYNMEAKFAMGPVFARHLGNRMYRGEYFAMQCDAHVDFVMGWDTYVIKQWYSAKNEMAVLTAYLSDVHGSLDEEGHLLRETRPIMCRSDWEGSKVKSHLRHGQQPEGLAMIKGEPTLEPYWAAGWSFSRGHFIVNIPYDQHLPWVFQGEEISIGLRGFTYGYDYYTPERSICFHYYASADKSGKRNKVNLFWENTSTVGREAIQQVEAGGMKRLNGILKMNHPSVGDDEWIHNDEQKYGLGKVRTPEKFFETFGVDVKNRKIEDHLCRFVGKNMMQVWKPHLRKDTMGINYDEIEYKFKDPDIHGNTWAKFIPKGDRR
eukprot:CAMPEP_0197243528 /NCGR_PEP_ID=MMETSP1429-20130617/8958_1 /TAXON_ID=49237 /ORGANISM="Chaetoceros  sp., Strain UNC1202" /LENGTH=527 /DNA_ID=CAMNT_0042703767 /DNA_START=268 /DNA_END=1854 /DNA_ORIENTATION=-